MSRIVDQIIADAHAHEFTPQEARWVRIEAAARAVLDAYADPLVQSVGDSPVLVELRAALDDPCPEFRIVPLASCGRDEHTPGPWYLAGYEIHDRPMYFDASGARYGETPNGIATVEYTPRGSRDANARLIAAAPDMLGALRGCRDMLRESAKMHRLNNDAGHAGRCEMFVLEANDAIAKATGGAQ